MSRFPVRVLALSAMAVSLGLAHSADAAIVPPTINWEADLDTPGDNKWDSSVNTADAESWTFASNQSPTDVSAATAGTSFSNIQSAYSFPAAAATRRDWQATGVPGGNGAATEDATFEVVFRLSDNAGDHVLFETGGGNRGTSITVSGNSVKFRSQQGTNPGQFAEVTLNNLAVGEFHQIVATIDMTGDEITQVQLFHNGGFIGAAGPADDGTDPDWDGSDDAGLGRVNGSVTSGSYTNFDGDIAILRYYRGQVFDEPAATQNFNALPEPGSLALLGMAGLAFAARRRR